MLTSPNCIYFCTYFWTSPFFNEFVNPLQKKTPNDKFHNPFQKKITFYFYPILCTDFIVFILLTSPIVPIFEPRLFLTNLSTPFRKKRPVTNFITPFREKLFFIFTLFLPYFYPIFCTNFIVFVYSCICFWMMFKRTAQSVEKRRILK